MAMTKEGEEGLDNLVSYFIKFDSNIWHTKAVYINF